MTHVRDRDNLDSIRGNLKLAAHDHNAAATLVRYQHFPVTPFSAPWSPVIHNLVVTLSGHFTSYQTDGIDKGKG